MILNGEYYCDADDLPIGYEGVFESDDGTRHYCVWHQSWALEDDE